LQQRLQSRLSDLYAIERELGRGAMARVFLARDVKHSRPVALKVLEPDLSAFLGKERFLAEIRLTANLQHPNILPLFDSGETDGLLFYVVTFVAGESLRSRLEGGRQLPINESLSLAGSVASALDYAHRQGVVHRDVKPENVLLSDGVPMIADFGIAKAVANSLVSPTATGAGITQAGLSLGTPSYMSPEQATGEPVDGRSDIYSLGCMLYEMLSGDVPFRAPVAQSVIAKHLTAPAPSVRAVRDSVPANVDAAVSRAMAKDPSDRFQNAAAFAAALLNAAPVATASPSSLTSVAVLPFVFLSDVENSRALSLGFADALITIFGNLADIVVAPTSSILSYAPGSEPRQICSDLGVRYALQGTVQKISSHWRVSIQLFDATTQRITFSDKHDFELDDMFDAQDEIGRRVVQSLQSLFSLTAAASRERYSSDPDAYNDFITGLHESASDNESTLRDAANHLSKAVERDPTFALAHATLSMVSATIYFNFDPQRTWMEKAERHCSRALASDPDLPEAHLARAWILWSPAKHFQHADAIAALEKVLAARPNLERAHNRMAAICLHIGRLPEARLAHENACRGNPATRTGNLEFYYLYSGDFANAEEACERWYRERPDNAYALYTRILPPLMSGDLDLAEKRLKVALERAPDIALIVSLEGIAYALRGESELALDSVRKALASSRSFGHTHHTYYQIGCVYALLGELELAMTWLERSVETGFACAPFFRLDPHLESLRGEVSFQRLVEELEEAYAGLEIRRL